MILVADSKADWPFTTRYQRQHSGNNFSNGMIWILAICGIVYIVYEIVSYNHAVNAAFEFEKKEINSDKSRETITNVRAIK